MSNRSKWTSELAKNLERLPEGVRDFVRSPESDTALLAALLGCLAKEGQTPTAADPLGGGLLQPTEKPAAASAEDPLGLGLFGRKRPAEEKLFGQGAKSKAAKAAPVLTLLQQLKKEQQEGLEKFLAMLEKGEVTSKPPKILPWTLHGGPGQGRPGANWCSPHGRGPGDGNGA